jgi:hypothetical protein
VSLPLRMEILSPCAGGMGLGDAGVDIWGAPSGEPGAAC